MEGARRESKPVVITVDSTADLSQELLERFRIHVIPLTITLGEDTFLDGTGFTPLEMYERFRKDGTLPKTSAPGVQEFQDFFEPFVQQGFEIVHLDISAELSNSFNAARLAAQELEGVYTVDTRMLCTGVGLLAIEGAECRERGMSAAEIAAHLESLREKVSTSFVLDTLQFMWKGGRCTGVQALGANLLRLKPALEMRDGKLTIYKKYRGSINHVYRQYITERLEGRRVRPEHVFLTESGEIEPSVIRELEELICSLTGCKELHRTMAGCTISTHCGPKTLGVLFIEE